MPIEVSSKLTPLSLIQRHAQEQELNAEIPERLPFENLNWCKAEKNYNKRIMYNVNMSVSDSMEEDEENESEFHILCRRNWNKQDTIDLKDKVSKEETFTIQNTIDREELVSNEETFTIKRIAQLID